MIDMTDLFKVLFGFGVFLALCAIGEIIAEYAPWIGYIGAAALIAYGMGKLYKRGWK